MKSVFCTQCGKELGKNATACPDCGKLFPYPDGAAAQAEKPSSWLQALAGVAVVFVIGIVGIMVLAVMWAQAMSDGMVAYMLAEQDYSGLPVNDFRVDRPEQEIRETPKLAPVKSSPNDWQDHISLDSCAWETEEADGWEALNIAFTVFNESGNQLFATYQVQKSGGKVYEFGQSASGIALVDGDTTSHTLQTTEFPAGTRDIELIISIDGFQDRANYTISLDRCAVQSAPDDAQERDLLGDYV
jgi:hypothetical protein